MVRELAEEAADLRSEATRGRQASRDRLAEVDEHLDRATERVDDDTTPDDPIQAGLQTLHELRDEYESAGDRRPDDADRSGTRPGHELDEAREHVQRLQDSVRNLGDVLGRYGQDLARPGEGAKLQPAATPTEPTSLREQRRQQAEAKRSESGERHARTKHRLIRLGLILIAATVVSPLVSAVSPAQPYAIATESMEPSIARGDLVVAGPGDADVGDVVVYRSALGSHQVHRVVDVTHRDGTTYYTTQGDANERSDSFSVPQDNVRGVVQQTIPYVGFLWLMPLELQAGLFVVMLVAYLAITFADDRLLARRVSRKVAAVPLVAAMLIPASGAMIQAGWPAATHTAGVADPSPIPLEDGTAGTATISPDNNSATATAPAPPSAGGNTWKETSLWGCWPFDGSNAGCHLSVTSSTYATVNASQLRVDMANYDPDPTFHLEAYLKAPAGEETRVRLFNATGGTEIPGSEVTTTDTSLTRVRSPGFNLSGSDLYAFQMMTTNGTAGGEVHHVKLLSTQPSANDTVTRIRVSGGGTRSGGGGWQTLDRSAIWQWDAPYFESTSRTVRFEVVAKGTGEVALRDVTNNNDRGAMSFSTSTTQPVRKRQTMTLVDGAEHEVRAKTGGQDTLEIYLARVIVEQQGANTTGRYVDTTWPVTSSATTFTQVGYPGRFHGTDELGNTTGRYEVTLDDPSGGTAYADLYNATGGQAVAGTQVSTGGGPVRIRTDWIDLDDANASYRSRVRTDSGSVEIRQAWAIFNQSVGTGNKTYDHVLRTVNDGGCTFDFHLGSLSVTNATRMDWATITLGNVSGSQVQFTIDDGVVTRTSGTAVGVAPGGNVRHVMQSNPVSPGRTEVEAELVGRCRATGVRTIQQVTYVFD